MNKYVGNGLWTGRVFYIPERTGASSRSYHGLVRRYIGVEGASYVGFRYSHGLAREEVRSVDELAVLTSNTVAAEMRSSAGRQGVLLIAAASSRQDRIDRAALWQRSFAASVGVRF